MSLGRKEEKKIFSAATPPPKNFFRPAVGRRRPPSPLTAVAVVTAIRPPHCDRCDQKKKIFGADESARARPQTSESKHTNVDSVAGQRGSR
jgi:hypothetical protein